MAPFRRSLHITGAYSAQHISGPDVTAIYRARSIADLRAECDKRNLRSGGSKAELVDLLSNHDMLQSRAFSIALRRIDSRAFGAENSTPRRFNTSRANKTPHDDSPIDLAYMPSDLDIPMSTSGPRVPVPPDSYTHYETTPNTSTAPGQSTQPMRPQIYSVSNNGSSDIPEPSAMSEVVDNHALEINPFDLAETVSRSKLAASSVDAASSQGRDDTVRGAAREMWSGFLDDVLGPKHKSV